VSKYRVRFTTLEDGDQVRRPAVTAPLGLRLELVRRKEVSEGQVDLELRRTPGGQQCHDQEQGSDPSAPPNQHLGHPDHHHGTYPSHLALRRRIKARQARAAEYVAKSEHGLGCRHGRSSTGIRRLIAAGVPSAASESVA
jgi:hypothetical protein